MTAQIDLKFETGRFFQIDMKEIGKIVFLPREEVALKGGDG